MLSPTGTWSTKNVSGDLASESWSSTTPFIGEYTTSVHFTSNGFPAWIGSSRLRKRKYSGFISAQRKSRSPSSARQRQTGTQFGKGKVNPVAVQGGELAGTLTMVLKPMSPVSP